MINFISTYAGVIGLIFFFTVFITIGCYICMPGRKEKIESYKNLPFIE